MPVTPTRIVAGALATRDFQDVHHDRDLAHKKGSKDIFLNINTSLGLMQRYVTDWAGPEALVKALRVKLGAPAYPYSPLTFTGSVQSVDRGDRCRRPWRSSRATSSAATSPAPSSWSCRR